MRGFYEHCYIIHPVNRAHAILELEAAGLHTMPLETPYSDDVLLVVGDHAGSLVRAHAGVVPYWEQLAPDGQLVFHYRDDRTGTRKSRPFGRLERCSINDSRAMFFRPDGEAWRFEGAY